MACKDKCQKYKAIRTERGHYAEGHKRCQICEIFIKHEGLFCPCCGYRIRSKPRNSNDKKNLLENKKQ